MGLMEWLGFGKKPLALPCQSHSDKLDDLQNQLDVVKLELAKLTLNKRIQMDSFNASISELKEEISKLKAENSSVVPPGAVAQKMQQLENMQQDSHALKKELPKTPSKKSKPTRKNS